MGDKPEIVTDPATGKRYEVVPQTTTVVLWLRWQ
jgi:hypothetical protein